MRQFIRNIGLSAVVACTLCGCGNFLEQHSQNLAYLENIEDLDELLLGECYLARSNSINAEDANAQSNWTQVLSVGYPIIHLLDDDSEEYLYTPGTESNYARRKLCNIHYWQSDPFRDFENKEIDNNAWGGAYRRIAVLNTILEESSQFVEEDRDSLTIERVQGEALFLRAQNYFWLANLYSRPYCKATAASDVCIPLKVTDPVNDIFYQRSPMEDVWGQIVEDLENSIRSFREVEWTTPYRANRAAAFALLSRVCLYMERYEEAAAYADSVIQDHQFRLLDFNSVNDTSVVYGSSPETIFTQGASVIAALHCPLYKPSKYYEEYECSGYSASTELLDSYAENDLRRDLFFIPRPSPGSGERCVKWRGNIDSDEVSDYMAIRLPEVYLNKAEALAQLGRDAEAKTTLEELLRNRFVGGAVEEIGESGRELVQRIRDERRRELCCEGHRWFDLRRYAVNTECPYTKRIEHYSLLYVEEGGNPSGTIQGKYVLDTYDKDAAAYMLPIPRVEIEFNEGSLTNEPRNDRPMVQVN